jgi:MoxR-like ATPase
MSRYNEGIFGMSDVVSSRHLVPRKIRRAQVRATGSDARYFTIEKPRIVSVDDLGVTPSTINQQNAPIPTWVKVVLLGAGIGVAVHLLKKSGWMRNPEETPFQVASRAAAIAVQANIPIVLWGPPGIGKTEWVTGLASMLGLEEGKGLEIVIGSTRDPADVAGILMPDGTVRPPMWAQNIRNRSKKQKRSILFLDEFSLMTPLVQAAFLRVIRDKIAGETKLEEGCGECVAVIAAANKPDETMGGILLPPPSANRMIHIMWPDPDPREWIKGLIIGWEALRPDLTSMKLPDDWKSRPEIQEAKQDVASFMTTIGQLSGMPKDTRKHFAWPSPRSWENAVRALACARMVGASHDVQNVLVAGAIGQAQASEFFAFTSEKNLPDPEELLKRPKSWSPPKEAFVTLKFSSGETDKRRVTRTDIIYSVIYSVVMAVQKKFSIERWKKAWEVVSHLESVTGVAERSTIVLGAAGLLEMIGRYEGLTWSVLESIDVNEETFGQLIEELQKAKVFKIDFTERSHR